MAIFSIGKELSGIAAREHTSEKLREQVTALFEEARSDVYRYLLTLGLRPPEAQDATQEVFLRLYATLRNGEAIQNPRAWIFRVAHNHGLKVRARQDTELAFDPELDLTCGGQSPDPEKELLERERLLSFHRAVENLSAQQRRCLLLRMEGLRYPEIGASLGISVSAVGEFLRRAIDRIRRATGSGKGGAR